MHGFAADECIVSVCVFAILQYMICICIIEALIRYFIALFYWFEDSERGENWPNMTLKSSGKPYSSQDLSRTCPNKTIFVLFERKCFKLCGKDILQDTFSIPDVLVLLISILVFARKRSIFLPVSRRTRTEVCFDVVMSISVGNRYKSSF
jgi:branched-subunit amino acid transport protein AzlD